MNIISLSTLIILILIVIGKTLPDPIYTIHYVKSYRRDLIENNFGCGKSIVYGTYIYPLGVVDGLYTLFNSHIYGFNGNCHRKDTYVKIFGQAQNFQLLQTSTNNIIDQIAEAIGKGSTRKIIIDWKYLPQQSKRQKARKTLEEIVSSLQKHSFTVFVKAPASYFCLKVNDKKYILDLPAQNYIVELYGQEPGRYTTYQSIFGDITQNIQNGYSKECPKYPTQSNLRIAAGDKRIYFEKTLDSSLSGYVGVITWSDWLQKAGESRYNGMYFYDGYPLQIVDL